MVSYNKIKWTSTFLPNREWINLFSKDMKEKDIYLMFNDMYMLDDDFDLFKQRQKKNTLLMNKYKFDKILSEINDVTSDEFKPHTCLKDIFVFDNEE